MVSCEQRFGKRVWAGGENRYRAKRRQRGLLEGLEPIGNGVFNYLEV
jgi:hypothetical protein